MSGVNPNAIAQICQINELSLGRTGRGDFSHDWLNRLINLTRGAMQLILI